jgi:YbbR domain-containing protein
MTWFRVDIGRALIALAIALLLYTYVHNETNPSETASFELPVDFLSLPPGLLAPVTQPGPSVRVRVSAPRDTLLGIRSSSLRASIDLRRGKGGIDEYPVTVEVPDPRVRLVEIVPAEIPVRLEEVSDKRVTLRINRSGGVPFGYEAGQADADPADVTISGPSSLIQKIASASVEVKLDGATVNIDTPATPVFLDSQGQAVDPENRTLRSSPETVRVRVAITQQVSYKTVPVRPTIAGNIDSGYTIDGITIDPPAVTLVAPPQSLRTVDLVDTAPIDMTDATATFTRQIAVRYPDGSSPVGADSVRVTVRLSPLVVLQPVSIPVVATNVPTGLRVAETLPFVQALLRGPSTSIRVIDPTQMRATVDLSGQAAGVHELPIEVASLNGVVLDSLTPSSVTVRLTGPDAEPSATLLPS